VSLFVRALFLLLMLAPACSSAESSATADDPVRGNPSSTLTIELVRGRADEIAASTGLDETLKATLAELYRRATGALETSGAYREAAQRLERSIQSAPAETEKVRAEIANRRAQLKSESLVLARLSLAELEQMLLEETGTRASLESGLDQIDNQVLKEQDRPVVIRQRLNQVTNEISEAESSSTEAAAADEIPELGQARRWAQEARVKELRAEIHMLSQELASHPMRLALLQARQDLATLNLNAARKRVQTVEALANEVRLEQSERAKMESLVAELVAADKAPPVVRLAARNTQLSKEFEALAGAIKDINRKEREVAEQVKRVGESFDTTRKKIEIAGISQVLGQVLQEQRRNLPDMSKAARMARGRENKIEQTALAQILLEEEQEALRDPATYVAVLSSALPEQERDGVADELMQLASNRTRLVEQALAIHRAYLHSMGELDIAERQLEAVVNQFDAFLAERLLWVRSSRVAGFHSLSLIPGQLGELLLADKWRGVLTTLSSDTLTVWLVVAAVVAVTLLLRRRALWGALRESGDSVGNLLRDRLRDTVLGFGIVILIALPWPLVVFTAGWVLSSSFESTQFGKTVGNTLQQLAPVWFQLKALKVFVAPGSIAASHFAWRDRGLARLHRDLGWFFPQLILAGALTMLAFATATQNWGSGLGRAAFVALMLSMTVFFYRLSHPNGGTISIFFALNQGSAVFRFRHAWFLLLTGSPLAAIVVALAGFMYTAGTIMDHILQTAWFVLLVIVVHQFVIRWLVLNQRKMRLQAARERRRAERDARGADDPPEETEGASARDTDEPDVDLSALDVASRKLTNNAMLLFGLMGVWLIWDDMLPAFGILHDVTLWTYSKPGVEGLVPLTLPDVSLAILIFAIMIVAARQLPAFLELTLLRRLDLSQGSQYTTVTLTRYTVVAVGLAWIFGTLGGSWSQIQWIFAALGVGIGFGLQEIVANFISGLIILFERPIRVGDVVTVGNTDGVVTRIRIRATTIRNWEQQELLVPNKNFITQELLNWSLTDQTTRLLIRLGVAYGSNVERAMRIMEDVADQHPRVMDDPAPFVVFEEFGDSTLSLSLRCYISDIDYRLRTITDLNLAINHRMAEAGIEIAFPQRDVHLDTQRPLDIRIHRGRPQGQA